MVPNVNHSCTPIVPCANIILYNDSECTFERKKQKRKTEAPFFASFISQLRPTDEIINFYKEMFGID